MYESALLASAVAAIIAVLFAPKSFGQGRWTNRAFMLFGFVCSIRFGNLYFWLNMASSNPVFIYLRGLDFLLVVPILALGLEMLHFNAMARVKEVNRNLRRISFIVTSAIMMMIVVLLLIFDIQTVRMIALLTAFPVISGIIGSYLILFRDNPLRIARPELVWGSMLVLLGYLTYFLSEGFVAGFLRMLNLTLTIQIIGMLLIGGGGILRRLVSFAGVYSRLSLGTILVNRDLEATMTTIADNILSEEQTIRVANEIISMHKQEIERVFETGNEHVIPYCSIESYKPERLHQIEMVPYRIDIRGDPVSVAIVLSDVTVSIEEKEKEQLAELLNEVVRERNRAEFYLDLLTHDMGNFLQAVLGGMQLLAQQYNISSESNQTYEIIMDQLNESITLIRQVRHIGIENVEKDQLGPYSISSVLEEAVEKIQAMCPNKEIDIEVLPAFRPFLTNSPETLKQGIVSLFRYIVHSQDGEVHIKASLTATDSQCQIRLSSSKIRTFDGFSSDLFKWNS
ncbi:MAG: hypothetical protein ACQET3_01980 [Promethearchaeati archaeon]